MKMRGADILIECLINEGVDTLFGYPGGYVIDIFDALYLAKDKITQILTCHEQGASHAADGYARASGKVGVCLATSGPGATNLVTGIATAYMDSIPMVAITGNVPLNFLGRDSFQEIDIAGVTMPITKYNYIIKDVNDIAPTIAEAFKIARSGRPGPVLVDIPKNVQQAYTEYVPVESSITTKPSLCTKQIKSACNLIKESKQPLLYIGGGVISSGASAELLEFAEKLNIPVASSIMGLGGFPASHPLFLGLIGMHGHAGVAKTLIESDLVIAVGSRFSDRVAGNREAFARNAKILHIDIDDAEIDKNVTTTHHVVGNVKDVLVALIKELPQISRDSWLSTVGANIAKFEYNTNDLALCPRKILKEINKQSPSNQIIATDVGQHQMWAVQTYKFENPRTLITSGGLGTMGFGVGAAIGAAIGAGKKATCNCDKTKNSNADASKEKVVLITGDGSFHMNFNEVVTAVKENIPLKIFLFNNSTLGMVRQWQKLFYSQHYSSTTLDRPTNFEYLAKAFGAKYFEINNNNEIKDVVAAALANDNVSIVNCHIYIDENVLPMIPPGKSAQDIITELKS